MLRGQNHVRVFFSAFIAAMLLLGLTPLVHAKTTYDPDSVVEALLNEPMLGSEDLLGGEIGRAQHEAAIVRAPQIAGITIASNYGAVGFNVYRTDEEAREDAHLSVLDPIQDADDPSITYYISWSTDSANDSSGAWVFDGNVVILGIATPQDAYDAGLDGSVGSSAALASDHAKRGLYFLRRIGADSNPTGPSVTATSVSPAPRVRPTETQTPVRPTATRTTTVVVPGDGPVAFPTDQTISTPPEQIIPGGLQMASGAGYRLERAEAVDLVSADTTTPRAVGTYSAGEVAWFLNHPDFMGGGPYREVQSLLAAPGSPFFSHFNDPAAMAEKLEQSGWQAGYLRQYSADVQSTDVAGWVEAAAHRFSSVAGAQLAARMMADEFAIYSGFGSVPFSTSAASEFAYSGPGYNGNETAIFVQEANYVVVVIGVAPTGSPDATIQAVVESALSALGT